MCLNVQYTWNSDRLWRKNKRKGNTCDGVDLNRNYPDNWAMVGEGEGGMRGRR